jgi:hypothetical protein
VFDWNGAGVWRGVTEAEIAAFKSIMLE